MNPSQARSLVQQTFTQAFDKSSFSSLSQNLLNHLDESKAFARNSQYIKEAFRDHVRRFERLGTYTSPKNEKLDVLIVHLTHESKLERARTAIRNFVADHLKERDDKDAALVAFVSPSETTWRFSYVKMEYATAEKDDGKVGVETRLTPARRFSYLVGEGESCHTAQTRFLDLLQDTESDPSLADIEEAFSVEAVTNEFFKKYVALFEEIHQELERLVGRDSTIRDEFQAKGVNTVDFAKKLMGQIVFLYFLQKKGWLGVEKGKDWGSGPRDFLRRLASGEYGQYSNFFNDISEPLFYDTLATDRGHEAWCDRFQCRIPFLNGGLFEPLGNYDWRQTDIVLPNKLFTNSEPVEKEEGITGTGVLDVFDRYNFTVNEAEPLEKEVAIDPEMLGKVFENLIEENRRKGLGAYYTPREIVHYMCQQSLINYLDTAVNMSAKPVAAEKPDQGKLFGTPEPKQAALKTLAYREIVPRQDIETFVRLGEQISHYESVDTEYRIKMPKSIQEHGRLMDEKLAEITVCDPAVGSGAFPVGMMTEIVRSRGALTPYFNDARERTPYYFKRHAIQNCLYGVDIDASAVEIAKLRLWLSLVVDEEDVKQVKPLPNLDYKIMAGNSLLGFPFRSQRLANIERAKQQFFDETDHVKRSRLKDAIDQQLKQAFAVSKKALGYDVNFDFEICFSEIFDARGGFDVVIGNPPYQGFQTLDKGLKATLREKFKSASGKFDLYIPFIEKATRLLRRGGFFVFICPTAFTKRDHGTGIRQILQSEMTLHELVDFEHSQMFENVTNYTGVFSFSKLPPHQTSHMRYRRGFDGEQMQVPQSALSASPWVFIWPHARALVDKIEAYTKLGTIARISEGIVTGLNDLYLKTQEEMRHNQFESTHFYPSLRGKEIDRYYLRPIEEFLFYPYQQKNHRTVPVAEATLRKQCPNYLNYLRANLGVINSRGYFVNSSKRWYELWNQRDISVVRSPKIVTPELSEKNRFMVAQPDVLYGDTVCGIVLQDEYADRIDLKYLLCVLNSSLIEWFFKRTTVPKAGGFFIYKVMFLKNVPVKTPPRHAQVPFTQLAERIIRTKAADPAADVSALEREIDQLVYALYGLTPEEIAIVEGNSP